ncbi:hypothetical protein NQZ71_12615 [Niallia taxi]|nr:hypothetical protein [Niallia taxi]MDE5051900.1 hypothetical protein [Niallia taxi]MED3963729.1 hypothetical protein [Niallia taxi]WOD61663.1 hypothetical protein NQZ71_12615 [Niallia taxi]
MTIFGVKLNVMVLNFPINFKYNVSVGNKHHHHHDKDKDKD